MARQFRELAALAEEPHTLAGIHMVAHNDL